MFSSGRIDGWLTGWIYAFVEWNNERNAIYFNSVLRVLLIKTIIFSRNFMYCLSR